MFNLYLDERTEEKRISKMGIREEQKNEKGSKS